MTPESAPDAEVMLLLCPFCGAELKPPTAVQYPKLGLARLHPGMLDDGSCPIAGWGFYDEQLTAWNQRTDPLHTQALAAGYVSVAEWVAALQVEIEEQCRLNGMGSEREVALLEKVAARDAEIEMLKQPNWFYADGWEDQCFDSPDEVINYLDYMAGQYVAKILTAAPCLTIWCAVRVTDDEDAKERFTYTEHASEEDARAALGDPQ